MPGDVCRPDLRVHNGRALAKGAVIKLWLRKGQFDDVGQFVVLEVSRHVCTREQLPVVAAAVVRKHAKRMLSKADRIIFATKEKETVGEKEAYSGSDLRLWLAAYPTMSRSVASAKTAEIDAAIACLAQATRWGFRQSYDHDLVPDVPLFDVAQLILIHHCTIETT